MDDADLAEDDLPAEPTGQPSLPSDGAAPLAARGDPGDREVEMLVEAALFSAGDPISPEQIAAATGVDEDDVEEALDVLVDRYGGQPTALEVARAGEKYAMQIRADLTSKARRFAPMEIPRHLLRTLALIAYHQPIKQSDLVDMIGSKAYDHVRELGEIGMIATDPHGLTKMLTTTESFPEYFGIDATGPDEIRSFLEEKAGLGGSEDADPDADDAGGVLGALLG